jgi:hypothetical protein
MPKLAAKMATAVAAQTADAGSGTFEPLPAGRYTGNLSGVEVRQGSGWIQWSVEFQDLHNADGDKVPGRQWYTLWMPAEKPREGQDRKQFEEMNARTEAKLQQFFTVAGYTTDSDTDEMIGTTYGLIVGHRVIKSGAREGERVNEVKGLFAAQEQRAGAAADPEGF